MLYRLKTPANPDPDHELGEAVTVARRAAKIIGASRDERPCTIELYHHSDAAALLKLTTRHPELARAQIIIYGEATPEAIAARYDVAPAEAVPW